jgi:hypothetical protein
MNEPPLLPPSQPPPPPAEPPLLPPVLPPPEPDDDNKGSVLAGMGLWLGVLFATGAMLSTNTAFLWLPVVALALGLVWVVKHGWNRTATGALIAVLLTVGFVLLIWSICSNYHYQG